MRSLYESIMSGDKTVIKNTKDIITDVDKVIELVDLMKIDLGLEHFYEDFYYNDFEDRVVVETTLNPWTDIYYKDRNTVNYSKFKTKLKRLTDVDHVIMNRHTTRANTCYSFGVYYKNGYKIEFELEGIQPWPKDVNPDKIDYSKPISFKKIIAYEFKTDNEILLRQLKIL